LHRESEDIACLLDIAAQSDAVFLGVLASAASLVAAGVLARVPPPADFDIAAHFAFVTLRGRSESPATRIARDICFDQIGQAAQGLPAA
ncbi:LysR family transcriptional regulator, partial [Cupriavidus sp. SIMBA_020]